MATLLTDPSRSDVRPGSADPNRRPPEGGGPPRPRAAGGARARGACGGAPFRACRVGGRHEAGRSGRPLARSGSHARPGARAPSSRADARVAVHLLPRGGGDHGCRPGDGAELGAAGAGVWRRPPRQLRRLRGTRSLDGLRHERLRRDRPRPVRMGRQAAGRKLRDRGPDARVLVRRRRERSSDGLRARTERRWPSSRR